MKFRTTKKAVMQGYDNIIQVGYCKLYELLRLSDAVAYTAGIDGWHADVYEVNRQTVIVTGGQSFGNIKPSYEVMEKYEKQAHEILKSNKWDTARDELEKLINEFVEEVTK
ncbi:hypothetical protein [Oribacterium sp.]